MKVETFEFDEIRKLTKRANDLRLDAAKVVSVTWAREKWHLFYEPNVSEPRIRDTSLGDYKMPIGKWAGYSLQTLYNTKKDYLVWIRDSTGDTFDQFAKSAVIRYLRLMEKGAE